MKWLCVFLFAESLLALRVSEVFVHLKNSRVHSNDLIQLEDAKKLIAEAREENKLSETEPGSSELAGIIRKNKHEFSQEAQMEIRQFLNGSSATSKASFCRRTTLRSGGVSYRQGSTRILVDTKANRVVIGDTTIQVDPQNPQIALLEAERICPGIPDFTSHFKSTDLKPE